MITITINEVDKTLNVEFPSLNIQNILTRKRDICTFRVVTHSGETFIPELGQEVIIEDSGTRIFGGVITRYESAPSGYGVINHSIECQDFTRRLDQKLVADTFSNQTVAAIIASLRTDYFPSDFTINNVEVTDEIQYIAFNYKSVAQCLEALADLTGSDWYVDYFKDIHFFKADTVDAPFDILDNDGSYQYDSLIIRRDNSQIRNSIIVRGGTYLGENFTSEILANGTDFIFPLAYKYSDFHATLTSDPLSVGIDYIDDDDSFDALHNFQEKILRFKSADTPTINSVIRVSGRPNLPVIINYRSTPDIASLSAIEGNDGEYQFLINDPTINTKEGARQRALAEVAAWANTTSEGEFVTHTSGLRAGMRILINSTSRGINEEFIINKVTISILNETEFNYEVSLVTTKSYDLIDLLKTLIQNDSKKIVVDENDTIDLVQPVSESFTAHESFTAQSLNYAVEWVLGDNVIPSGKKRQFILSGSYLQA
jgi:hypothetical protein